MIIQIINVFTLSQIVENSDLSIKNKLQIIPLVVIHLQRKEEILKAASCQQQLMVVGDLKKITLEMILQSSRKYSYINPRNNSINLK